MSVKYCPGLYDTCMFHELGCDEFRKVLLIHIRDRALNTECYLSKPGLVVAAISTRD